MASKLGRWLGTLTADQLAEILNRRPDALAPPVPRTLGELADRLQSRPSVSAAFHSLPQPAVELIEVLQAIGGQAVPRSALAEAVGRTADDSDLETTLRVLAMWALVWPDGGDLRMAGPLWSAFPYPLHLGPLATGLLSARTADELRRIAAALRAPVGRTKQDVVRDLVALFADGERVRKVVAAQPAIREMLEQVAWHGPVVRSPQIIYGYGHSADSRLDWALSRGLLVADGWQAAIMPAEVGRALRGPDWHAPFTPHPPAPALASAGPVAVAREAAAAAGRAVGLVTALLEVCDTAPPALLKAGGVGARELKRLGKAVGGEEGEIRLWLELAHTAGLLSTSMAESVVLPTDAYDEWSAAEPAGRLAPLLHAWWRLPGAPLVTRGPAGEPAPAALTRTGYADVIVELRHEMLRAARDLPSDRGMVGDEGLVRIVAWRVPLLVAALDDPDDLLTALWRETRLLGLVAHGAVTPLGRALIDGDDAALTAAAHDLLPPAVSTALFQADLTAVVPGTPATSLAMLLDAAADRESRGGAAIWRFSPASIRRAFDAGATQAELLDGLRGFASGGALPQPLEYLVADIARRHGQLRVRTVACVIRGNDEALLAEIAAVRSLAPLNLALLAPTVLASGKPLNETLAALRAAGYAPVGESRDGTPVVERATRRRATGPRPRGAVGVPRTRPSTVAAEPADPLALAAALLSGPPASVNEPASVDEPVSVDVASEGPAGGEDDTESVISQYAPQLSGAEQRILSHAVEHGARVKIHYTNAQGNPSTRVIEPLGLYGHVVEAWCHLREDERMFALERIDAVSPA